MPISAYSTTAGSNTSVAGINIAEGCPAANMNNAMRAQMADTRSFYEGATWTDLGHTPVRTGATTFTINSDVTAYYIAGRRIRCTDSTTLYGTIASSSYSAPNTTVTVTLDSGSLSVSLTAVAVSVIDPTGDPIGVAAIASLPTVFADNVFRVQDNGDATKQLAFEISGITTGTTSTLTVTDTSLAIPANSAGPSSLVLAEDTDNGSNTATIIAPSSLTADRTYTLPDETGTIVTTALTASDTVVGIVELATDAETQTGTDTTRAVTPAGLYNALGLSFVATSTGNAITNGGLITFAHGLGRAPRLVQFHVVCGTNDATSGYVAGDVIYIDGAAGNNTGAGYQSYFDATNVNVRFGANFNGYFQRKSDGAQVGVSSLANFTLTIRAWA
jgi:hypothetical protein